MIDVITLAVAEKYTRDSLVGLGALKGAPCTISKTETVSDGTEITFKWTGDNGSTNTRKIKVTDGISVVSASIGSGNHLLLTLSDSNVIDAGVLPTVDDSSTVKYTNPSKPSITNVKQGLDEALNNIVEDASDVSYTNSSFPTLDNVKKALDSALSSGAMIEDVIPSNASVSNKLATIGDVAKKFDVTVNATSNPIDDIKTVVNQLVNMSTKTTTYCGSIYRRSSGGIQGCFGNYDISVYIVDSGAYAGNTHINGTLTFGMGGNSNVEDTYSVSCSIDVKGSGETYWNIGKLATTDDILDNNHNGGFMAETVVWFKTGNLFAYPNAGGFYSSTFLMSDRDGAWTGILKLADDGAGSVTATIVSLGASPRGGEEFYYDETSYCLYFCGTWDRITITQLTGKKADLSITSTTQEEAKQNIKIVPINITKTDDIFLVGDRRNTIGWADLSNSVDIDGSSNYANNIGRIEGHNAIIEVSNPNIGYQWPVTNSGDSNKFMDFGGAIQFFVDKVNNHLYVRFADSVDMSAWGEIVTMSAMNTYAKPHIYNLSGATYPTLQTLFDELVTRLKADTVGNDYGICFMGTWTGKSFFEGSFYTVDGHSSYFKITFQNPQDSKSLYTGYTGYSDVQVTYRGVV